jgi:general secretion pathway protein N
MGRHVGAEFTQKMKKVALKPSSPSSDSSPWRWAVFGSLLGLLVATMLFAPAAWLGKALALGSQGRVVLNEPSGTVWNGSGQLVLSGGAGSRDATTLPGRIHWRLKPTPTLKLRVLLDADCCTTESINLLIMPRLNGAIALVQPSQSSWPATLLTGLGAPFNTLDLQATLKLNTQVLTVEWLNQQLKLEGKAALDVIDASTRLSTLRPVGSYRLNFQGSNGAAAPNLNLETLSGSLLLSGSGQLTGNRWRFNGEASAAPGFEAALSNFLDILGRRVGPRSIITVG